MNAHLKIALIQPVIDPTVFWEAHPDLIAQELALSHHHPYLLNVQPILAEGVWQEIQQGLRQVLKGDNKPDMILIPELHMPPGKIAELKKICRRFNVLCIAGVDFQRNPHEPTKIRNRGVLIIPGTIGDHAQQHNRLTALHFGKTYFSYMERQMFRNIEGVINCTEDREQNMYIFQTSDFGNFGIMICSDIFDLERMILYQGQIQHLLIISLNKDLNTYFAMAESLTRMLYCNVVICNTGQYGGSLAISPYDDVNDRTIYKYYGQKMLNIHQLKLPVSSLAFAQSYDFVARDKKKDGVKFKASPPGYFDKFVEISLKKQASQTADIPTPDQHE